MQSATNFLEHRVPRWDSTTPAEAEALIEWQLARAWQVAETLQDSNQFYSKRIESLPSLRTAASFTSLPLTTKADVVDDCSAHPPFGLRHHGDRSEIRHVVETSGTSGAGKEIYALGDDDEQAVFRAEAIGFWWAGARPGTTVLMTLPIATSAAGVWYYGGLRLTGSNVIAAGSFGTERKLDLMRRFRPEIIVGTPSYVQRLGAACVEDGLDPRSLGVRALVVAGESYGLAWAQRLQEQWGASLYEQYGCTERAMAWTCPGGVTRDGQLGVLHFPPELAYVEVIDPRTGIQAEDGCEGEIIVTPLQARLSPLLRFSTRDRVQFVAAGSCSCGRPLRGVRAGSVRRYDDMIKVRGVNIWPAQFDAIIFSIPEIAEYRGRVRTGNDGAEHLDLTIEVNDHSALSNEYLVAEVKRSIGLSVQVFSVGPGVLTNSVPEGFVKLSRWQDDRDSVNNSPVTHL